MAFSYRIIIFILTSIRERLTQPRVLRTTGNKTKKIMPMFTQKNVCPCCQCTVHSSDFQTPLSRKEFSLSGMCASCQNETYAATFCEGCNALTLFTERTEANPDVFACKLCHTKANEYGDPKGTVHVTKRCLCCAERFVVYYDHVQGTQDVRYGSLKCNQCEEDPDRTEPLRCFDEARRCSQHCY